MFWIAIGAVLFAVSLAIVLACCKVSGDLSRLEEREARPFVSLKVVRRLG
jgi:hypothetical protein